MFYKTQEELNDAIDKIFAIYCRLIGTTKNLGPKERFNSWKEAVKAISGELDSICAIARLTNTIPQMLISVDKYVCWSDDIGSPDTPFPNWKVALQPDDADIAGHPWLMKVECRFDVILTGQTPQSLPSTSQPATPMATCMVKEKGRATDVGVKVRTGQERLAGAMDDDGESEVEDMDQLMDDDDDEKHRPRGRSRQRKPRSTMGQRSKSRGKQHEVDELEYEDNSASKKSKPSMSHASEVPCTPIAERATLPSDPNPCDTCIFRHIDCVPNPRGGVCKPCKSHKIRCSHSNRPPEHPATAPPKAAPTTSSTPHQKRSHTRTPRRQCSESTSPHETDEEEVAHVQKKARVSGAMDVAPWQSVKAGTSGQNCDWGKYCSITPFVPLTVILAVVIPQSKRPTIWLVPPAVRSVSSMEDVADATSTGLRDANISPSPVATTTTAVSMEDHAVIDRGESNPTGELELTKRLRLLGPFPGPRRGPGEAEKSWREVVKKERRAEVHQQRVEEAWQHEEEERRWLEEEWLAHKLAERERRAQEECKKQLVEEAARQATSGRGKGRVDELQREGLLVQMTRMGTTPLYSPTTRAQPQYEPTWMGGVLYSHMADRGQNSQREKGIAQPHSWVWDTATGIRMLHSHKLRGDVQPLGEGLTQPHSERGCTAT
ncbi:hypothetical protein EDD15DRAFT_2198084 [Pisolithus albus]|nr:hypothetical protein EDD15DRAFT_2198084 [Pisolithus albus]